MKILIAEDERELAGVLSAVFEHNGYSVDVFGDGLAAFNALQSQEYDVAVMDIMMPGMDGLEVVRKMRSRGSVVTVILLTARGETDDKVVGLDAGADDYLTKPFQIKELLARVRALTRRNNDHTKELGVGNTILNPKTFSLSTDFASVRLTAKEYHLSELLFVNCDVVVTTEKMMEEVWGYDSEAEVNTVWVFISLLRKKLIQINSNLDIKSVRGIGYTLKRK